MIACLHDFSHRIRICIHHYTSLKMAAAALARIFGGSGKKGEVPSPQAAIQKLRETEEMLGKKSEFLEKKIEKEMAAAKKAGMKNKRGVFEGVVFVF